MPWLTKPEGIQNLPNIAFDSEFLEFGLVVARRLPPSLEDLRQTLPNDGLHLWVSRWRGSLWAVLQPLEVVLIDLLSGLFDRDPALARELVYPPTLFLPWVGRILRVVVAFASHTRQSLAGRNPRLVSFSLVFHFN